MNVQSYRKKRIVALAQTLHQTREAWRGGSAKPDFSALPQDQQLAWMRVACIVADDEALQLANDIPDLYACAHNAVVSFGTERFSLKKFPSLRDSVNRSRAAFERALDYLHGMEHTPCLPECRVTTGGLFHDDACPRKPRTAVRR